MNRPEFDMEAANDDEELAPVSGEEIDIGKVDTLRSPPPISYIQPVSPEQRRWEQFMDDLVLRLGTSEREVIENDTEYRVMYQVLQVQFGISAAKDIAASFFESIK